MSTERGGFWRRWRFGRRRPRPDLDPDDPRLVVVVTAFDDTEAASASLARGTRWRPTEPALLRHHLVLPPDSLARAAEQVTAEGYAARTDPEGTEPDPDGRVLLTAARTQLLDALHCAQERSRMAGLAQRLGGDALGWEALQPEVG
ncbi:ribonuclease E inhibitor RraB [Actinoalloteichus spitiensis]|uniref:ribonuclease E inhibitor RraB n=1 Tax=Actinoalloteichus spitiensis TaxID=252394 RepID=UPI000474FF40|nr:ribonuclease E inhibitor RraB [Actinoalloteichus spitiensis]